MKTGFIYEESYDDTDYDLGYYKEIKRTRAVLATLDWSTMSFSEEKMDIYGNKKQFPACAIIQDKSQNKNIAFIKGLKEKGMDFIKLETLTTEEAEATRPLPMELHGEGLGFSQLVTLS